MDSWSQGLDIPGSGGRVYSPYLLAVRGALWMWLKDSGSRRINQTQEARIYSHGGPIRRRKHGHILRTCLQSSQMWASHRPVRQWCVTPRYCTHPHATQCVSIITTHILAGVIWKIVSTYEPDTPVLTSLTCKNCPP